MAMETEELTDAQTQALLSSDTPLADVYRYFDRVETDHMDVIRDCIENRANDICKAHEEQRNAETEKAPLPQENMDLEI